MSVKDKINVLDNAENTAVNRSTNEIMAHVSSSSLLARCRELIPMIQPCVFELSRLRKDLHFQESYIEFSTISGCLATFEVIWKEPYWFLPSNHACLVCRVDVGSFKPANSESPGWEIDGPISVTPLIITFRKRFTDSISESAPTKIYYFDCVKGYPQIPSPQNVKDWFEMEIASGYRDSRWGDE